MLDETFRCYGFVERATVIPNARDPQAFSSGVKQNFVFSAGRVWDEAKNFRVLGDAAGSVEWPVYLAGERANPDGGTADMNGFRLLGSLDVSELAAWYSKAAIYALPALYEPFGLTALEAALSGCALVLSDIPSLREVWGNAACYVDPRSPKRWSAQLNELIHDGERRVHLAGCAHSRALEFNTNSMTRRYIEAYQQARQIQRCESVFSATPFDPTGITGTPISSAA